MNVLRAIQHYCAIHEACAELDRLFLRPQRCFTHRILQYPTAIAATAMVAAAAAAATTTT